MKKTAILFSLLIAILYTGCSNKNAQKTTPAKDTLVQDSIPTQSENPNPDETPSALMTGYIDTSLVWIDTLIRLPEYTLAVTKNKYNGDHQRLAYEDTWLDYITLYALDLRTDSILSGLKTEQNLFVGYPHFGDSLHYIILSSSGGGSGFISGVLKVEPGKNLVFTNLFNYNELTYYMFSNDGTEILYLQGYWATEKDESHFDDHQYYIGTVDLAHGGRETETGTTRYTYPSNDHKISTGQLIQKILKKEPALFKKTDLTKYTL